MSLDHSGRFWAVRAMKACSLIAVMVMGVVDGVAQESRLGGLPQAEPAAADHATDPMSPFARLIGGEWTMTATAGTSLHDTWHWGPGKHSVRGMTHGLDAAGNPWRVLEVLYWHPGHKQIRMLAVQPFARGVLEGVIAKAPVDQTIQIDMDAFQIGRKRALRRVWELGLQDKYRMSLLESVGRNGYEPLAAWDYHHSMTTTPVPAPAMGEVPVLADRLKPLEPLIDRSWERQGEARGEWAASVSPSLRSTIEWIPYAEGVYARVIAPGERDDEPEHLYDVYMYHHTGKGVLCCLALSKTGDVYEGDVTVLEGGSLQADLKGHEAGRAVAYVAKVEFPHKGSSKLQMWSQEPAAERVLKLDVELTTAPSKK